MRPRTSWAAKTTALTLAAGLAATAGGLPGVALPGVALAATGSSAAPAASAGGLTGDVCSDAGALLGIAGAACQSVASAGLPTAAPAPAQAPAGRSAAVSPNTPASQGSSPRAGQGSSQGLGATVSQVAERAVAPVTAVLGVGGTVPVLKTVPVLGPLTAVTGAPSSPRNAGAGGASAPGTDSTAGKAPAAHAGDTNVPAATQVAGLGALPGLADLPSAGLASTPPGNGAKGGGIPLPRTALSAANSGMSSDSFAALAVGALLAGASALKIAGRRTRDRKAGIGVAQ
jgi:hypothetical protein